MKPGIYLIVHFNWLKEFTPEIGKKARRLHDVVQGKDWIREAVAASGGLGGRYSSLWIFWLENYAALDRLFRSEGDEVTLGIALFSVRWQRWKKPCERKSSSYEPRPAC